MDGERGYGELGFGRRFTEHMAVAPYRAGAWTEVDVVPFAPLSLSPAAMVFHYGQAVFEGLKAFAQRDGGVALFRPHEHARRFDASARRLAMPALDPHAFVAACEALLRADAGSVPTSSGESLYLRPMMIATEAALGVRPAGEYLFVVMASPVGSYFTSGNQTITVWATPDYTRAAAGGVGSAKCAGNYAASLAARLQGAAHGCEETLWLDAVEHRWIEELGGMNVVFVHAGPGGPIVVAPPAGGTVLDGVTRRSVLELARHLGYEVVERPVSIDEACEPGAFDEALACGTAAGAVAIGAIRSPSGGHVVGRGQPGPVTVRLRDALLALQEGRAPDPFGWRLAARDAVQGAGSHPG
jgi:branched-chain amino acid aminotransferase